MNIYFYNNDTKTKITIILFESNTSDIFFENAIFDTIANISNFFSSFDVKYNDVYECKEQLAKLITNFVKENLNEYAINCDFVKINHITQKIFDVYVCSNLDKITLRVIIA